MSSPPPAAPSSPASSPALLDRLLFLLAPLRLAAENETYLRDATRSLGWDLEAAGVQPPDAVTKLRELGSEIDTLVQFGVNPPRELEDYLKLLDTSAKIFESLRNLGRVFGGAGSIDFSELGRDLLEGILLGSWYRFAPISFAIADLLTLVQEAPETTEIVANGKVIRYARPRARVRFDRLGPLLRDPAGLLREEYFTVAGLTDQETAFKAADRLFPRLAFLARQLGLGAYYGLPPEGPIEGDPGARDVFDHMLTIFGEPDEGPAFGASMMLSSEPGARGLIVSPFGQITFQRDFESLVFSLETTATINGLLFGEHLELRGGGGLKLHCRAEPAQIGAVDAAQDQVSTFGGSSGSGLQIGKAVVEGELEITDSTVNASLGMSFDHVRLQIAPSDGDSFLSSVLPKDGVKTDTSLAFNWSTQHGFHFSGSAGLELTLPLHASFGPLKLDSVTLGIATDGSGIRAQASVTAGLAVGPFAVQIDRVGLQALVDFPEHGGNLGVADLALEFKPPNGLGLSINAATVVGGGFLHFADGEYSGVIQLEIAEKISVKGIALLSTKLPSGGKGYSLIIIIFVEGFNPIQLGLGFVLTGIGGLLALNRTFDEDALRAGLQTDALSSVMFPVDPVRNAPQILSNLNRLFPPAAGHHLFGPMVQLAWGTPPLITADVALVLELGARRRLLILAQVLSILPRREHELVRLQMDAVGVLDFDQGTAALDATLRGSRLLNKFPLTGEMAMRMKWEESPNFALAVGGLHPAFNPPPNFPKLQRVAINISSGDNPRLRCEAYFALTANTVQFGARAELFASAAGFSVHGEIGFDVLIQFDPFSFLADFHAQLQLKRGSHNLFMVELSGSLAGPRPLHIKGKAKFSILWWSVSFRVDKVLVAGEKPPLPEPIEVLPRLKEALGNTANWTAKLPTQQRAVVQLRADPTTAADVLLHPLGTLTIKQTVVPLNIDISRFGQATPSGASRFSITSVKLDNNEQHPTTVKDSFAPAQFFEMTDDEKLSRPSFESMDAGITFGSDEIIVGTDWQDVKAIEFETWLVDDDTRVAHRSPSELPPPDQPHQIRFYELSSALFVRQARFGAAGSSGVRRSGKAKYRVATAGKYQIKKEGWSIVDTDQDPTVAALAPPSNYSQAVETLEKIKRETPERAARLQILRLSEMK